VALKAVACPVVPLAMPSISEPLPASPTVAGRPSSIRAIDDHAAPAAGRLADVGAAVQTLGAPSGSSVPGPRRGDHRAGGRDFEVQTVPLLPAASPITRAFGVVVLPVEGPRSASAPPGIRMRRPCPAPPTVAALAR
jgi:hypothetical protein